MNENIVHLNSVSVKEIVQCCLNKPVPASKLDLIFKYVVAYVLRSLFLHDFGFVNRILKCTWYFVCCRDAYSA